MITPKTGVVIFSTKGNGIAAQPPQLCIKKQVIAKGALKGNH